MKTKSIKKRNWTFVLYPESAPSDWRTILESKGLAGAVSPLHDKDKNEGDGTPKKAHYHIILTYPGPTTYNCVKSLCDELAQPIPQPIESVKGIFDYLTHSNNPEKVQYDKNDIVEFGGFHSRDYFDFTKTEVITLIKRIQELVREADILEYSDLLDMLVDNDMADEYEIATTHTLMLGKYIDSRRNKLGKDIKKVELTDGVPL